MSNPCPEILQSAKLQVSLGKGKRERHYGTNHFLNQFIKLVSSNVDSSWQQNREMAYSDAGHKSLILFLGRCGPLHMALV